jgi:uncharacterized repeat protein (TIGR03803 family)
MPNKKSKHLMFSCLRNANCSIRFALALCLAALTLGASSLAQTVTDVYDFTGYADGWDPNAPMIAGPDGSLYGTTLYGGYLNCPAGFGDGCGTVYRLSPSGGSWTESTLYQFRGGQDGSNNYSTLTLDSAGNVYGVTDGGTPWNAIFRLTAGDPGKRWHFALLYKFKGQRDGGWPLTPLFVDSSGAIYGASSAGGLGGCGQYGCGAIFQLVPPTHKDGPWTAHVLYEFQGANDGGSPSTMIMDSTGTIYGTTSYGGEFNKNCPLGCGVIFQLFPVNGTWAYKVLYAFHGAPHESPWGNLVQDASGNLFGLSGAYSSGYGDIFELSPPAGGSGLWNLSYIHRTYHNQQRYPATNLTLGPNGSLYGDIYGDQDLNAGYIFQLTPPTQPGGAWTYTTLVDFNQPPYPGENPCGVVVGLQGDIYSPLSGGGYGNGNIVSVVP